MDDSRPARGGRRGLQKGQQGRFLPPWLAHFFIGWPGVKP